MFRFLPHIFLALTCCIACNTPTGEALALSDLPSVYVPAETDSVIEIKHWLALGPFEFNPRTTDPARSFLKNDLQRYGIEEGIIDDKGLEKLQKRKVNTFLINESSPKIKLFDYVAGKKEKMSNFYVAARILSDETQIGRASCRERV